jgi:predicted oxidoreductase
MADADVIVVGAGLAGLVAACELVERGRRVLVVDQENANNIGGQAFWSFGGLFFVDSPEQRRLGIRDSHELALQDWLGTAGFDRPEDHWPRQWAHAYVDFAAGEKRSWLRERGLQIFPVQSAAATTHAVTATRCRASTSHGGRARRSSTSSRADCLVTRRCGSLTAIVSTN